MKFENNKSIKHRKIKNNTIENKNIEICVRNKVSRFYNNAYLCHKSHENEARTTHLDTLLVGDINLTNVESIELDIK